MLYRVVLEKCWNIVGFSWQNHSRTFTKPLLLEFIGIYWDYGIANKHKMFEPAIPLTQNCPPPSCKDLPCRRSAPALGETPEQVRWLWFLT